MNSAERRQSPRTTIAGHAYVNIEPNNGGIVLNVSDGGLCFHAFDPVPRNGKIRFWFAAGNRRIEADATLAWTDETQKGGLRFIALPAEARQQILNWTLQSATSASAVSSSAAAPRTTAEMSARRPATKAAASPSPALLSPDHQAPRQLSGFSRGLVTGLMVSAMVAGAFLFHGYRRELGESLIRLGERFAAEPRVRASALPATAVAPAQLLTSSLAAPVAPPAAPPIVVAPPGKTSPQAKPLQRSDKIAPPPVTPAVQPKPANLEPVTPPATAVPSSKAPAAMAAPAISSPPAIAPVATAGMVSSNPIPGNPAPTPTIETKQPEVQTESSTAENGASTSELFFDVGKFKNPSRAHIELDRLAQLGFPATAVQKGFLWTNSYHILVGPYSNEDRAKTTHQKLVSSGFKPRPFERGSRAFTLGSPVTLNGMRTPAGEYIVSWESSLDDASVKLLHHDYLIASANGRWTRGEVKYPRDAYVYRKNPDGTRTLLEIRFGGTRQALVFGKPS